MRLRPLIAGFVLLSLLTTPSALADHVFSHRYFVEGRVLDAAGEPVAGLPVNATLLDVGPLGYCYDQAPDPATDRFGDFQVCFHAHGLPENATAAVTFENETFTEALNTTLRRTRFFIELSNESEAKDPVGTRLFPVTYRVTGRVFNASGPMEVERVPTEGNVVANAQVALVLQYNGVQSETDVARTDLFGDYSATFRLEKPLVNGTLALVVEGEVRRAELNATFMRSGVDVVFDGTNRSFQGSHPPVVENPYQAGEAPGSTATPGPGLLFAAAAVAAAAAVGRLRRRL